MASNLIKRLMNHSEDIFLQLKIYQIRRSIRNSKTVCSSMRWYIIVFVVSSLMIKAVIGVENWCLCNGCYSCPVVAEFVQAFNYEEGIQEFLSCHFEKYWTYAYTTTSTISDVLVIIAALNRDYRQLVYPWLFIKCIALIVKISYKIRNYMWKNEKITTLQLVALSHVIYSWYYVYTWSHKL